MFDCESPLTEALLDRVQADLGLTFPPSLRKHFLAHNGGRPERCVYDDPSNEEIGVHLHYCLPLLGGRSAGPLIYRRLVTAGGVVPKTFFPF
jgi:hypothetical protein